MSRSVLVAIVERDDPWPTVFYVTCIVLGELIRSKKLSCEIVVNGNFTGSETDSGLVLFPLESFSRSDFFNMADAIVMHVFCELVVLIGKYTKENLSTTDYYELNCSTVNFLSTTKKGVKLRWNLPFTTELELFKSERPSTSSSNNALTRLRRCNAISRDSLGMMT